MELIERLNDLSLSVLDTVDNDVYALHCGDCDDEELFRDKVVAAYGNPGFSLLEKSGLSSWKELHLQLYRMTRFSIGEGINDEVFEVLNQGFGNDLGKLKRLIKTVGMDGRDEFIGEELSPRDLYFALKARRDKDLMDNMNEDIVLTVLTSNGRYTKDLFISLTQSASPELVDLMIENEILPGRHISNWFVNVLKIEEVEEENKVQLRRLFKDWPKVLELLK